MSAPPGATVPYVAYQEGLCAVGERKPAVSVVEVASGRGVAPTTFAARFPGRWVSLPPRAPEVVAAAVARSEDGASVFVEAPVPFLLADAFPAVVRSLVHPRRNAKLVGLPTAGPLGRATWDDLGAMRGLPAMTVVAPADGPTTRTATVALAERDGPAYVRLPSEGAAPVTDGTFSVGRAHELRAGSDLTVIALGAMVARAAEVAGELARVGVSVRLLDAASVKPFDEAAVLRSARDTGAILVAEDAALATGVGTVVAAMTAENYPVPVRRLGLPDVAAPGEDAAALDRAGLSVERLRDEAWELLRLRGKAT
ncbi:MAG TPA: transketolase C-terminal domain-containing protein [Thermoplasmata archaeon]|nr:transketolase C-terminal domain-containing protein [Thermoplasmata archaeon]